MANHAHSTRTPLLPQACTRSALLPHGVGRQPGPVTLALRAMRTADPDRQQVRELRASIAGRIAADLALLDTIDGRLA